MLPFSQDATIFTVMNPDRKIDILGRKLNFSDHLHAKGITIRTGH